MEQDQQPTSSFFIFFACHPTTVCEKTQIISKNTNNFDSMALLIALFSIQIFRLKNGVVKL